MTWQKGRQGTGYFKKKIFSSAFLKIDCYLLWFPKGSRIPIHTDPVDEHYKHHRLNIVLKKAKEGGRFIDDSFVRTKLHFSRLRLYSGQRLIYFRPDVDLHCVTPVKKGSRYVLSIGWLTKKNGE